MAAPNFGFFSPVTVGSTLGIEGETSELGLGDFFIFLVDLVLRLTVANFPQNKRTRNGCLGGRIKNMRCPEKNATKHIILEHGSTRFTLRFFVFFWNDDFRKNQHGIVLHMILKGIYLVGG